MPWEPSTVSNMPSLITDVPTTVPTTHGMRYSRATMAQWLRTPPVSDTTALTVENREVQGGMVISHTRTSPGCTLLASDRLRTTFARPCTVPREAPVPVMTSGSLLGSTGTPSIFLRTASSQGSALGGGCSPIAAGGMTRAHAAMSAL